MNASTKYLIITAGGKGTRIGADIPKQFLELKARPIILHTIDRFLEYDKNIRIIVVLPEEQLDQWRSLCSEHNFTTKHAVVSGGAERFHSVKNGLALLEGNAIVAIHDAVRPLVSFSTIEKCFALASELGNAIPVIAPAESIREELPGTGSRPLNREKIKLVQTPQIFKSDLLHRAYDCDYSEKFTDDATVVERLGENINLVEGNRENIKITTPEDLLIAEALLK